MATFVFSQKRLAELRQRAGQLGAILVLPSNSVRGDAAHRTARDFYREIRSVDGDGRVIGPSRLERVEYHYDGERRPDKLTVLLVELTDVHAEIIIRPPPRILNIACARACGFKTVGELREDWTGRHPRADLAKLVWFILGDVRDQDRFLRRYISRGGDYGPRGDDTIDELPALSEAQLKELAVSARQKDQGRRAEASETRSGLTLAQRVAQLEALGGYEREIRQEMKIIASRTQRGHRKLTGSD